MNRPAVTIILPTYNGSRYLEKAVASCRFQTFRDWELIIVDDASTDATPEIISRLLQEDGRIRTVRHEINRKLPAALNTGFSLAQGRYLTWTSDDNLYRPAALQVMVDFLERNSGVDIVYTDYEVIDSSGAVRQIRTVSDRASLVSGNFVGPSFLYRKHVHELLEGYDESLFLAEDYDFWLRASVSFAMYPLHQFLYQYRMHSDSLSITNNEAVDIPYQRALLQSLPRMVWLNPRETAIGWLNLSALALSDRNFKGFAKYVCNAMMCAPLVVLLVLIKFIFLGRRATRTSMLQLPDWLK
ncbi:MAG TPA: glycosyltransferase [Nitrosomonas sp.]|nr:glycosyltransferase [Nitrosomonas sp.]